MKNLDLNLLPPLQVLLELKNISRAAERLQLSQPATSAAMARLRRHFDDELLVRNGRTYNLTPFAQSLVPLVDEALLHIQRATRVRSGFDPGTSEREFIIAASDYAAALIVGPLRGILRDEAPGVSVDFMPTSKSGIQGQLADFSKIDLLVGPMGYHMQGASRQLFRDSFVVVADAASSLLQQPRLSLEDLVTVPHAVGYFGEGVSTPADKLFESLGLQRRVAAVVAGSCPCPCWWRGRILWHWFRGCWRRGPRAAPILPSWNVPGIPRRPWWRLCTGIRPRRRTRQASGCVPWSSVPADGCRNSSRLRPTQW